MVEGSRINAEEEDEGSEVAFIEPEEELERERKFEESEEKEEEILESFNEDE